MTPIRDNFAYLKLGLRVSLDGDTAASLDERVERGPIVMVRGFQLTIQKVKGGVSLAETNLAEMKAAIGRSLAELPSRKSRAPS